MLRDDFGCGNAKPYQTVTTSVTEREWVFSKGRRTISWIRAQLGAENIERIECLKNWQQSDISEERRLETVLVPQCKKSSFQNTCIRVQLLSSTQILELHKTSSYFQSYGAEYRRNQLPIQCLCAHDSQSTKDSLSRL